MKRIVNAIALFVASTFITAGVWAQDHQVKATVPFNFTVNGTSVPSGKYTIGSESTNPNILNLRDRDKGVNILAMGLPDTRDTDKTGTLIFHRYGDQYFLSEIRCGSASLDVHFAPTKEEKQARKWAEEAGLRVNSDVLIALNQ